MYAEGVLARHVGDVRRGLEVIMGAHRRDPQSVDVPLHGPPVSKRVALVAEPSGGETDPESLRECAWRVERSKRPATTSKRSNRPMLLTPTSPGVELMATSFDVVEPLIHLSWARAGVRFLELSTRSFAPRPQRQSPSMHRDPVRDRSGLARVLYDLSPHCWSDLDAAALSTGL